MVLVSWKSKTPSSPRNNNLQTSTSILKRSKEFEEYSMLRTFEDATNKSDNFRSLQSYTSLILWDIMELGREDNV